MKSREQLIGEAHGLVNVKAILTAASRTGIPVEVAFALFEKETHGANIYGHDKGGIFSTRDNAVTIEGHVFPKNSNIPVTPSNAGLFLYKLGQGDTPNGLGPGQITWSGELADGRMGGWFREMLDNGKLPWDPADNMEKALQILKSNHKPGATWEAAGTAFNGDPDYGVDLVKKIQIWRGLIT